MPVHWSELAEPSRPVAPPYHGDRGANRHNWTCGDLAEIVSGPHSGLAGTVFEVIVTPVEPHSLLAIRSQLGELVTVPAADVIPI